MGQMTADVTVQLGTTRLSGKFTVAEEPIVPEDLLPIARAILERILGDAVADVEAEGKRVSCAAGCGACCRQLVPISAAEARAIVALVEAMPEPRQSEIRRRFAEAGQRLEASGMAATLRSRASWAPEQIEQVGLEYFRLGIPCPFLEDESCSIHPDRPLTCREYLVTSDPKQCAAPTREGIDQIPLAVKVWPALAKYDPTPPGSKFLPWTPLSTVLDDAERTEATPRPGPETLEAFFRQLTGKPLPGQVVPFAGWQ